MLASSSWDIEPVAGPIVATFAMQVHLTTQVHRALVKAAAS
jgi:hypothetical protein